MLTESIKARVDSKKPRQEGLTYIIDKLEGLDKENFEAKIDLLNHANNNTSYSPGHIIKGKVILLSHLNQEIEERREENQRIENYFKWGRKCLCSGATKDKYN